MSEIRLWLSSRRVGKPYRSRDDAGPVDVGILPSTCVAYSVAMIRDDETGLASHLVIMITDVLRLSDEDGIDADID